MLTCRTGHNHKPLKTANKQFKLLRQLALEFAAAEPLIDKTDCAEVRLPESLNLRESKKERDWIGLHHRWVKIMVLDRKDQDHSNDDLDHFLKMI